MILENLNYIATVGSIIVSVIIAVFGAGFYFNKKVREACADQNTELESTVTELTKRIIKLEEDCVPIHQYESDLKEVKDCIRDMHNDVKQGIQALSVRIDNVLLNKAV